MSKSPRSSRRDFVAALPVAGLWLDGLSLPAIPPADDAVLFASLSRLARLVRDRQVSSSELVRRHLERIAAVNPKLNAVVQLAADRARAEAAAADRDRAKGVIRGPLHGVPITIKDSLETAGIVSTAGTAGWAHRIPAEDAAVVARLRRAGAIVLGKTNTPEFTLADETDNLVYGRTNNPFDLDRTPGGSSGGAAAIVAAGGSPLDLGSDTGNSIRYPSHVCGVAGIKPTSGRVPRTGHAIDYRGYLESLTSIGPIARSVEDLALVLPLIAGPDGRDPHVPAVTMRDPRRVTIRSLRVTFYLDNGVVPATEATRAAVRTAARALEAAGASVTERTPPGLVEAADLMDRLLLGDGGAWVIRLLRSAGTDGWGSLGGLAPSTKLSVEELTLAIERLDDLRSRLLRYLADVDLIVCPVQPGPATGHGTTSTPEFFRGDSYSNVFNLTGWPAASVPGARSPEGLPIGVQVVAGPWREDVVLAAARVVESALGGYRKPPL
jgi:amidase